MGTPLSRILDGLYVGPLVATRGIANLKESQITHICSLVSSEISVDPQFQHRVFVIQDHENSNLFVILEEVLEFVHTGRMQSGVLVHCVSIILAYLMTIYELSFIEAYKAVRGTRPTSCPNSGFVKQLSDYEISAKRPIIRAKLLESNPVPADRFKADLQELHRYIERQEFFIEHGFYPGERPLSSEDDADALSTKKERKAFSSYFAVQNRNVMRNVELAVAGPHSRYIPPENPQENKDA
ncbi:Dual specificity protein phosphatase 22 [Cichlidogyrus casuarinus]|uniref:Dual specificity protein phosphatase 22 n=1 Tax=Cichlidogyrus casuarinus TaxID=1844966 RepID=A0ABD2Q273_9PLAT